MEEKSRIKYLDIAKGFAILFMFTQHCMLVHEISAGDSEHWLSVLFVLLGTAPAAPVFMIIMGVFLMKSKSSIKTMAFRGLKLLLLGYILNVLRFPMVLDDLWGILIINDILQLAGLSYLIGALIKKYMSNRIIPLILFASIFIVSPYLWGIFPDLKPLYLLWGTNENTYFPLFPWLVYPLLGMYLEPYLLDNNGNLDRNLSRLSLIGLVFLLISILLIVFNVLPLGDYLRSGFSIHLLIIGIVFIWLNICRSMELKTKESNRFVKLLSFMSINITLIYYLQWILFSWLILFIGANEQNVYISALIGLIVFVITIVLARIKPLRSLFLKLVS